MLVRATAPGPQTEGDCRVEVPARDMADRIGHGQHRQAERGRDAKKADPETGEARGKNGAAAAAEGQPERSEKFGDDAPTHIAIHVPSPPSRRAAGSRSMRRIQIAFASKLERYST